MLAVIRKILKSLPSLITALMLATAAWIAAVSSSDPERDPCVFAAGSDRSTGAGYSFDHCWQSDSPR